MELKHSAFLTQLYWLLGDLSEQDKQEVKDFPLDLRRMCPGPRAASTVFRTMSAQWRLVALTASKSNCRTRQNTAGKAEAQLQNLLETFPLHNRNRSISISNGHQNLAEVSSLLFSQRLDPQMRGNLSHAALERLPYAPKVLACLEARMTGVVPPA